MMALTYMLRRRDGAYYENTMGTLQPGGRRYLQYLWLNAWRTECEKGVKRGTEDNLKDTLKRGS